MKNAQSPSSLGVTHALAILAAFLLTLPTLAADRAERIIEAWHDAREDTVLVVAHRGAWREAPENSLAAIEASIAMGCDMVEIDVRQARDGGFVLMHDTTLDRTTETTGPVNARTTDELTALRLRDHEGSLTDHRVPTLREALETARGRVMLNLDKCGNYLPEVLALAEEVGVLDHIVVKSRVELPSEAFAAIDAIASTLDGDQRAAARAYMPILDFKTDSPAGATARLAALADAPFATEIPAIEVCLNGTETGDRLGNTLPLQHFRPQRLWMNSLWDSISGGRSDDRALEDPDAVWGWMLDRGVTVIQTDHPRELLEYLRTQGRRW